MTAFWSWTLMIMMRYLLFFVLFNDLSNVTWYFKLFFLIRYFYSLITKTYVCVVVVYFFFAFGVFYAICRGRISLSPSALRSPWRTPPPLSSPSSHYHHHHHHRHHHHQILALAWHHRNAEFVHAFFFCFLCNCFRLIWFLYHCSFCPWNHLQFHFIDSHSFLWMKTTSHPHGLQIEMLVIVFFMSYFVSFEAATCTFALWKHIKEK